MLFLLVSLVVISLAFAGANFLAWQLFERPRHALIWSAAYALASVQYAINLAKDFLPSSDAYWISASLVSFALVILATWGHRERLGMASLKPVMIAIFAVMTAAIIVLTKGDVPPGLKVALSPTFSFIAMTFITSYLLRARREPQLAQNVAAGAHFLFGLTQGASAVVALSFGAEVTPTALQTYTLINFALMPAFFVAMGISAIFLLATDLSRKLTTLSLTDELTQVANRRGYFEASERLRSLSRRNNKPLSIILCDIDRFKSVNDKFGHAQGDVTLIKFAKVLVDSVRAEDVVGRVGGEEFAITLAGIDKRESGIIAERIRSRLEQEVFVDVKADHNLTASFGVAELSSNEQTIPALLHEADTALYCAKEGGRNQVVIAPTAQLAPA